MQISHLDEPDLLQAYALVRLHDSELTLHAWCCRVSGEWEAGCSHWAAVRDGRGYMHAVFRYVIHQDAAPSRQSEVTDLYAAGWARRHALAAIRAWSPGGT